MNKPVKIVAGSGGYGGPLVVQATETCNKILCMTAIGGIHPLGAKLAEMTGGEAVDGHKNNVPDEGNPGGYRRLRRNAAVRNLSAERDFHHQFKSCGAVRASGKIYYSGYLRVCCE